jgi:hypothetical protein
VLVGPTGDRVLPEVYVGEGDPVGPRLDSHFARKDFWQTMLVFTSKDDNLNKAHIQHLEARLIAIAHDARRCELENGNVPALPSLSEMDAAEVEGFLEEMLLCLPVLGVTVFQKPAEAVRSGNKLYLKGKGITAEGYESPEGFVVLAESMAAANEADSTPDYLRALRKLYARMAPCRDVTAT